MFSFRLRLSFPGKNWFVGTGQRSELDVVDARHPDVVFSFQNLDGSDKPSTRGSMVVEGRGYPTSEDAGEGGDRLRAALMAALARSHMAADFGNRSPGGGLAKAGRQMMEAEAGRPVLNDSRGDVLVFESKPRPVFASVGAVVGSRGPKPGFDDAFQRFVSMEVVTSERVESAFDTYSASFFTTNPDVRLVQMVTAIEFLITRDPRGDAELEVINEAITNAQRLVSEVRARDRLINGLRDMRKESIGQAGQRLVGELLHGGFQIGGAEGQDLFQKAYKLRSRIVHGDTPRPSRDEVSSVAAPLEIMVGDLIAEACLASSSK